MEPTGTRTENDSMGELHVPAQALWGAQTQRAEENFPISGLAMPPAFIQALGLIKATSAEVNRDLGLLEPKLSTAIIAAAERVATGELDEHFPVDVFQTGSGTSSNMNANEVIARLASGQNISAHPNDHVNMGQSSNDVIPTAIHVSASLQLTGRLLPAMKGLAAAIDKKSNELVTTVKTGRTHLMDALPITFGQELSGWKQQIEDGISRIESVQPRLFQLAQGGTAVGTGVNAHPEFSTRFAKRLAERTKLPFLPTENHYASQSSQDTAVELSGQLKTLAVSLMKIANDLRWMNSGPLAGLGEIELTPLQPGSSIMPGKVNPVIPESVCQVAAQVIGNDTAITLAGQSGNFQLNVMLPLIAYNLLQSIELLANVAEPLGSKVILGFRVNSDRIEQALVRNPILITALNEQIGYDKGAEIAKQAFREHRPILEVAAELLDMDRESLRQLLDPAGLV